MSKVQETSKQILMLLPGTDCGGFGGCGYPTCQACAEAIAEKKDVTLCPACSPEDAAKIANIVNAEPIEIEEKIAFIRCAGSAAGKERFAAAESCQQATESGFLQRECQWGCVGVGSCVDRCTFDAMSYANGQVTIHKDKCTGCLACVSACPQQLITMVPKEATNFIPCASKAEKETALKTCGHGCIGCGECETACPQQAVHIIDNCAVIDYEKCAGCAACTVKCEKKIIIDELHDLRELKEEVAFVKCVGASKGNKRFRALGMESCKEIDDLDLEAMGICSYSCSGFGDCTAVCRYDAISITDGVACVDTESCVGCGDCMRACPRNMIRLVPYKGVKQVPCAARAAGKILDLCKEGCIGCSTCADNCPNQAIEMIEGTPEIDSNRCENCGICTYLCPRDVITERQVPEYCYLQDEAMKIEAYQSSNERKW